jgi:fructokinase
MQPAGTRNTRRDDPDAPPAMRIGIDLGGTKIEVACLDGDGTMRLRRRVPTPYGDYAATVRTMAMLVREARIALDAGDTGAAGANGVAVVPTIGVGIPGTISALTGRVKNANSTWLNGQPLMQDLESALGQPVRVQNDANCLAVSEATDGAGAGARVVFAAILGTGVGAGIAIDGRALGGHNGIAGEWGHVPLPLASDHERPGPACWCGRRGCIETWLSGPALQADHRLATGADLEATTIATRSAAGDPACSDTLERYLDRAGRALAMVVNIVDPDVIVLGGGLSNIDRLVADLPGRIAPHVFSDAFRTPVRRSQHGDSSGVRGAAWLW